MLLKIQQSSVIRYCYLSQKTNEEILLKLQKGYQEQALHIRAVEKLAARFRGEQTTVEDESRTGRPRKLILATQFSNFWKNNHIHFFVR
jgi:NAD(P)H-nitrite reductase large subunit